MRVNGALCYSKDGKLLALTAGYIYSRWLVLWDAAADAPRVLVQAPQVIAADFSPEGTEIAVLTPTEFRGESSSREGNLELWLVRTVDGQVRKRVGLGAPLDGVAYSLDGQTIALTDSTGRAAGELRHSADGQLVQRLPRGTCSVAWREDGWLAAGWWDGSLWLLDPGAPEQAGRQILPERSTRYGKSFPDRIYGVSWLPGAGDRLVIRRELTVELVDARRNRVMWKWESPNHSVKGAVVSPDETELIVSSSERVVLDLESGQKAAGSLVGEQASPRTPTAGVILIGEHADMLSCVLFQPGGAHAVAYDHYGAERLDPRTNMTSPFALGALGAERRSPLLTVLELGLAGWFLLWIALFPRAAVFAATGVVRTLVPAFLACVACTILVLFLTVPLYAVPEGDSVRPLGVAGMLLILNLGCAGAMLVPLASRRSRSRSSLPGCGLCTLMMLATFAASMALFRLPAILQNFSYSE